MLLSLSGKIDRPQERVKHECYLMNYIGQVIVDETPFLGPVQNSFSRVDIKDRKIKNLIHWKFYPKG